MFHTIGFKIQVRFQPLIMIEGAKFRQKNNLDRVKRLIFVYISARLRNSNGMNT